MGRGYNNKKPLVQWDVIITMACL